MNRERIERGKPLLLPALDQYGNASIGSGPIRVSHITRHSRHD
jgi:hypothetical protein